MTPRLWTRAELLQAGLGSFLFGLTLALVAALALSVRGILRAARVAASLGRERAAVQEEPLAP